jgi:hypothetical protein
VGYFFLKKINNNLKLSINLFFFKKKKKKGIKGINVISPFCRLI